MLDMRKSGLLLLVICAVLSLVPLAGPRAQDPFNYVVLLGPCDGAPWLDGWQYRRAIEVESPCGATVVDYQVQITLDAGFAFANAAADGSDVVVTASDGTTMIPYWIETWDPMTPYASIWVKVPEIPVEGTCLFVYYGGSAPAPVVQEVGPIGPWTKQPEHIVPIGDPGGGSLLVGENIVYDPVTAHYWMVFAIYRGVSSVGLVWTDNPDDPDAWNWHGQVVASANAPHIIYEGGLWHIFYADRTVGAPYPISVDTATNIGGPYHRAATVLTVTEPWEAFRVDEPYCFQRNDGKWILMYMGDQGSTTERIGYAEADNILGPYTKFAGNPCIDFGPPGSIDAGTVADPWVVELNGVYYIGYTVSPTKSSPWNTALVTTEDWLTFTKHGIILDLGGAGAWDQFDAFRGAVTRFGDTYYFAYTGSPGSVGNYVMGLATMSAFQEIDYNDAEDVFEFIDLFDGDALDASKWVVNSQLSGGSVGVAGGLATLTGTSGGTQGYVQMRATTSIATGTLMETYASHLDAGLNPGAAEGNAAAEVGYKPADFSFSSVIRIMDWPNLAKYCLQASVSGNNSGYVPTAVDFDTDWHAYRIFRTTDGFARFQVDANPFEALGAPYVPTAGLFPWFMSYARNTVPQSRFGIDWVRVRNWCGADAAAAVGPEQSQAGRIFGNVTAGGSGLLGVVVELLTPGGDLVRSAVTDAAGYYLMDEIPGGDYLAGVVIPIGFGPVSAQTVPVTVAGGDSQVDFVLSDNTTGKVTDLWWWKRQFQAIHDGAPLYLGITLDDVNNYCQAIFDHYYSRADEHAIRIEAVTYMDDPARPLNFDDVYYIYCGPYDNSNAGKTRQHLLIDMLNVAAARMSQLRVVSADGATLSQAIHYYSGVYLAGGYTDWTVWYNLMKINLKMVIPAGVIPLSTPNVMYKPVGDEAGMLPDRFALAQNYPNPFNAATTIVFDLPTACEVRVEVLNALGQKVTTLVDEWRDAGRHAVSWNADEYATGVYFYRIATDNFVDVKKALLLK